VRNNLHLTKRSLQSLLDQDLRVWVVNQGSADSTPEWLSKLNHPQVLHTQHYPQFQALSGAWNYSLQCLFRHGAQEVLVANNDTWFRPDTYETLLRFREYGFVTGVSCDDLEKTKAYDVQGKIGAIPAETEPSVIRPHPDFSCFLITKDCYRTVGAFDEHFIPCYCLTPDTLILTSELHWIPIGRIKSGDTLIGVDEFPTKGLRKTKDGRQTWGQRGYKKSIVTGVHARIAPCLKFTLDNGKSVVCSTDHKWLSRPVVVNTRCHYSWRMAKDLSVNDILVSPLDPWIPATSFQDGWLSGILDGEGCIHSSKDKLHGVQISQKPGLVFEHIKEVLTDMGIPYTSRIHQYCRKSPIGSIEINARKYAIELLGRLQPCRLNKEKIWKETSITSRSYSSNRRIVSIEEVGPTEVISLETTTKTFIANGIVSHNCEDQDYHRRMTLAGIKAIGIDLPFYHERSSTVKASVSDARNVAKWDKFRKDYYEEKWGQLWPNEQYEVAFNGKKHYCEICYGS
jgi:hypothetical protein